MYLLLLNLIDADPLFKMNYELSMGFVDWIHRHKTRLHEIESEGNLPI